MTEKKYILCKTNSESFADGWQIYREVERLNGCVGYKYGYYWIRDEYIIKKYPLESLKLDWIELEKRHEPTFFEKIKMRFGIKYPEIDYQRPKEKGLVIVDYGELMEVAEVTPLKDGGCHWVTELDSYMKPKKWAYLSNKIKEL